MSNTVESQEELNPLYTKKITNREEAESFYRGLSELGKMFHPEDSPETIINIGSGKQIFAAAESKAVRERVCETYQFLNDDPCAFIVDNNL